MARSPSEPVPERLKLDQVLRARPANGRSLAAMAAAAAIVAFLVGGAAGWMARGASAAAPTGFDLFTAEALDAYKLYVVEVRHPVEVPGSERAHMTQWLSKRLGYRAAHSRSAIDRAEAGRRPAAAGPDRRRRVLHVRRHVGRALHDLLRQARPRRRPRCASRATTASAAFYWVDDKVAYVVSGPADRDRLETVTKSVYEQVDKTPAAQERKSDRTNALTPRSLRGS